MPTTEALISLLPAVVLLVGASILILSEAFLTTGDRRYQAWLAGATALAAAGIAASQISNTPLEIFGGTAKADPFQAFLATVICLGLLLSVMLAASYLAQMNAERGEFYALMLFGASGMALLVMATDLITIFVALEIVSIATYALVAYLRRSGRSTEAAFKYFILGALASALFLYGASLAYGATGSIKLDVIAAHLHDHPTLIAPAFALIVAGFGFKVAAAPFHMWAPDVYEGAPTPVTAFMAVGVKAAAFGAFFRILTVGFGEAGAQWGQVLVVLAIVTMLVGNLLALPQRNVKRMLAYSSVAHAGYVLVALAAAKDGASRVAAGEGALFYLLSYTVAAVGAFGVVAALEKKELDTANAWDLDRFAGLAKRRPGMAFAMALFMLSLAGVPPTVGFIGKLLVFKSAIDAGQITLAVVGIVTAAIGAYYYLRVIVYIYFHAPEGEAQAQRMPGLEWALWIAAAAVGVLGVGPGRVIALARAGAAGLF